MNTDTTYMQRCIDIAANGLGHVSPNPLVGCIIVYNSTIIGEGFHKKYGEPHAEVNAINSVKDKSLLKQSTLYVNLEPCCHQGKTPPCTDLIIKHNIPRVVIGCVDSFTKVDGKGIKQMQDAGIIVTVGILDQESRFLNRRFFTVHTKKRPYIFLKWAQTQDGFMDIERIADKPSPSYWITNTELKIINHKWRSEEDAIMIGTNTAINDNPQLTTREFNGRNPIRIVIDKNLTIPATFNIFNNASKTLVFTSKSSKTENNIAFIQLDFSIPILSQIFDYLYTIKIQSLIIEGGFRLLNSCITENFWDEATQQIGAKYFNKGLLAPIIKKPSASTEIIHGDRIITYYNI